MSRRLAALLLAAVACSTAPTSVPSARPSAVEPSATAAPTSSASAAPQLVLADVAPDPALVERLQSDVSWVARERPSGSPHWLRVQSKLREALETHGFEVEVQAFGPSGKNVIGTKRGASKPSELVILSAHYDHVWGCEGADDNGSGIAVVLEAARVLGRTAPERTLVLAFWDEEEIGLVGSQAYARRARERRLDVKLMLSLDGVGFADSRPGSQRVPDGLGLVLPDLTRELEENDHRGDFIAVIGDDESAPAVEAFRRRGAARGLRVLGEGLSKLSRLVLIDTTRSDHASFWLAGFPGILVTDTANFRNPGYHCYSGPDSPSSLDYVFLARVAQTTIDVVSAALR